MSGRQDRKKSEEAENEALRLYEAGTKVDMLVERFGLSRGAIGRWLRNARERRASTLME